MKQKCFSSSHNTGAWKCINLTLVLAFCWLCSTLSYFVPHTYQKVFSCLNLYNYYYSITPLLKRKKFLQTCFELYNFIHTSFKLLRSQWRSCGHRLGIAISGMWEIFKWATSLLTHYIQVWQPFEIPQKTLAFKNKNKQFWLLFSYAH